MTDTNNANILENMSRDYLEIELDAVKNENMLQSKRMEEYKIQIYKLKHRVAMSKTMEGYFKSEIESLQSIHAAKIEELLKKISIHEELIQLLHEKHTETIKYYEKELIKKDTDFECINELKKSSQNISQNDDLVKKITELNEALDKYELTYNDVVLSNKELKNKNSDLTKELLQLKEQLYAKEVQLDEKQDLITNLQNEITLIRKEVNNIKDLPVTENS